MMKLKQNDVRLVFRLGVGGILGLVMVVLLLVQPVQAAGMAREIDHFLTSHFKPGEPGIAVLAVKDDRVVIRKGYGLANLEHGIRMSPNHVFRIGSITKQFTAVAVMLLQESGKLNVNDPITKYLDNYPTHGHTITIKHLLNHTSGIRGYTEMSEFWENQMRLDMSLEKLIDFFKKEPMDFPPGDKWLYNNSGYILLGAIIEKVSGKAYADFIREQIFKPLGMKHSYYGSHLTIIPGRAAGYQKTKSGFLNCDFLSMKLPYAAGSLLSTVDDLHIWTQALASGKVVSRASLKQMTNRTVLNSGKTQDYGYGLSVYEFFGQPVIGHGGGINGFSTYAMRMPDKGIFVTVMSNCPGMQPNPSFISQWIAALIMGKPLIEKKPLHLDDKLLESYVGLYKIAKHDYREVTKAGNQLYTRRGSGARYPIYPESRTLFYYKLSFSRLEFVSDSVGRVTKMVMHRPEGDEEAVKTDKRDEDQPAALSPWAELAGEYGEADGFKIKIFETSGKLMAQGTGQQPVEITEKRKDLFVSPELNIRLEFRRSGKGRITGFFLYQNGLKIIMDRL